MPSDQSSDSKVQDNDIMHQKLNLFTGNDHSVRPLHRLQNGADLRVQTNDNDNYNSTTLDIRCEHPDIQNMNQPNRSQLDYYEEFRKIYVISYHLSIQKNKQVEMKGLLEKRIKIVQDKMRDLERQQGPKNHTQQQNRTKRSRRTAEEIEKRFKCDVQFCQRYYGSEGSLQQHIKLKHPQLYKKSDSRQCSVSQ